MSKEYKGSYCFEEGYSFHIEVPDGVTEEEVKEKLEEFVLDRSHKPADYFPKEWDVYTDSIHGDSFINEFEVYSCIHASDGVVYTTNPPQYKCKKCNELYTLKVN